MNAVTEFTSLLPAPRPKITNMNIAEIIILFACFGAPILIVGAACYDTYRINKQLEGKK